MPDSSPDFVAALYPFDRAELARLRRYVAYADELAGARFLGEKLHYRFHATRGEPYEIKTPERDEAIDAWFFRFRPLHLAGRRTSATYRNMQKLIGQHLRANAEADVLRSHLELYEEAAGAARTGTGIQLHVDEGQITPGQALDDWLNGVYFHDDEDKLERVDALRPFGFHHYLALVGGRDLSSVYLGFSNYIVRPITQESALCAPVSPEKQSAGGQASRTPSAGPARPPAAGR